MVNKKGLSEVVTNVLIILLVVVAVGLLWRFVLPLLSGDKISQASLCLDLKVEPTKCINYVSGGATLVNATVQRSEVKGDIKEVKLFFEMPSGDSLSSLQTVVPGVLETKAYTGLAGFAGAKKLYATVGIVGSDGVVTYCPQSVKIDCV